MRYESIADIYSANRRFRDDLVQVLEDIRPDEAAAAADDEGWTIAEVAEHVSIVESGIARICAKLVSAAKADAAGSNGRFELTEKFGQKAAQLATAKLEAPDRVRPTGEIGLQQAIERLSVSTRELEELRADMEGYDLSAHTFPHPYFGDLTAAEWLLVAGRHERRHMEQIQRILQKIRK